MAQLLKETGNLAWLAAAITAMAMPCLTNPAFAQAPPMVKRNALEKTSWHTAPREFQIIDDTPVVRDFREAPQNAGSMALPPGPGANGAGGHGEGALGPLGGAPGSSIPSGGMPLPGGDGPGYRTAQGNIPGLGSLPKSGFGGSNIPAHGMGPRGLLPGVTTGVVGKLMSQKKPEVAQAAGPSKGLAANPARTVGNTAAPTVASYSGGYGTGTGSGYGGSASRTETFVRGSLLRK